MEYPKWIKVRQKLDRKKDKNPAETIRRQLTALEPEFCIKRGDRIAVTVGSRYISNLVLITKTVIEFLKSMGANPFLVPAMGSHGGASSQGQLNILEEYGFSEDSIGIPILSSMETVFLGEVEGIPVYFDKHAFESDHIVVINRIKPHQFFRGEIQSGLSKMMALGLGKQKGADAIHAAGRTDVLGEIGDFIRAKTPVIFGVAILENAYDQTRNIAVVKPEMFRQIDAGWVKKSRRIIPKIPVRALDMVIVAEMGKDLSGSGMDTNVIGFTRRLNPSGQVAVPLAVLDLTEKSGGNAIGIGLADLTTRRLVDKIDYQKTYTNVIATGIYSAGRTPIVLKSERDIMDVVLKKLERSENARLIRIKNTLHLDELLATTALLPDIEKNKDLSIIGPSFNTEFHEGGDLICD